MGKLKQPRSIHRSKIPYFRKIPNKYRRRRKDSKMENVTAQMILDLFTGTGCLRADTETVEKLMAEAVGNLYERGYSPELLEDGRLIAATVYDKRHLTIPTYYARDFFQKYQEKKR
jgi:hypothetical protein